MAQQISPLEAEKELSERRTILLDVRHKEEVEFTSVKPHIWIELQELPQRFAELPKEKQIICLCRTGSRSAAASDFLQRNGYNALNLHGGIFEWGKIRPELKKYGYNWVGDKLIVREI